MRQLPHYLSLCDSVSDLVVCDHELFVDRLHRVKLASGDVFHAVDFTEGSLTKLVKNLKTGKFNWGFYMVGGWLAGSERL